MTQPSLRAWILPVLLLGGIGGACWQPVRFSAEGCGWTMGLLWGLAWWFMSAKAGPGRRPYGSAWMVLACVAGFYFGGMHGYGQFHHWIKGVFELSRAEGRTVDIHPLTGYWWVFLCGAGWGGVAGVFLSWPAADCRVSWQAWVLRVAMTVGMAWLLRTIAVAMPELIMPLYEIVDYSDAGDCPDCTRTTTTLVESMMWIGFWMGGVVAEILRRAWRNAAFVLVMGIGFGVAFTAFEWLHLLSDANHEPVYWWSLWEASIGTLGGALLGICYFLFNRLSTTEVSDAPRFGWLRWPRAEYLLGLWLPLLLSLYYVIPFRTARGARWQGFDEELARQASTYGTVVVIGILGLMAVVTAIKTPAGVSPIRKPAVPAQIFLFVYLAFFLISYLPRFALYGEVPGILVTQGYYGGAFVISLVAFWQQCRAPRGE